MKKSSSFILFLCLINIQLFASNYHVQPNGNDANNGLSFNTAFKTIQTATNKVVAGDSILVYNGFYKGFDHFYKGSGTSFKPIVYYAMGTNVVINQSCGRGYDGLNIEGSDYIHLIGFKVSKISDPVGNGEDGIRAVVANHITIQFCEVDSCYRGIFTGYTDDFLAENNICKRSYGEHGIYVSNNSDRVVIRNNICFSNKAAGIQLNPDLSSGSPGLSYDVSIYNNICYSNRIGLNLQGLYNSFVYNNLLYNNGSNNGGNGITLFLGDAATGCHNVKVYNNTVVVPSTSQWAILAVDSDSLMVKNNILLSYSSKGSLDIESSCKNYYGDYNLLVDKMTTDQGNTYINFNTWKLLGNDLHSIVMNDIALVFKNLVNNDYHLSVNSPAIDAGTSDVANIVKVDLDSLIRPISGKFDIGCYEKSGISGLSESFQNLNYSIIQDATKLIFAHLEKDMIVEVYNLSGELIAKGIEFESGRFIQGIYCYHILKSNQSIRVASGKFFIAK